MPINNLNATAQSAVNLYINNQQSTPPPRPKPEETTPAAGPEKAQTVNISDRAKQLAAQNAQNRADFEEDMEQEKEIQQAAAQKILSRQTEVRDEGRKSIDLIA